MKRVYEMVKKCDPENVISGTLVYYKEGWFELMMDSGDFVRGNVEYWEIVK